MDRATFTYLLTHPENVSETDAASLQKVLETYPYLQSARALHLKALKNKGSSTYNQALKRTAAYTADRSVLFEYITSQTFRQPPKMAAKESQPDTVFPDKKEAEAVLNPDLFRPKEVQETVAETSPEAVLQTGKPLEFTSNERHSFNEWLKLTALQPIDRTTETTENDTAELQKKEKFDRIDKFIAENPKIVPKKAEPSATIPEAQPPFEKSELMTETLARVYLEQKKYKDAIQAYKILSLKYPEKSGFFADQIKAIKNLQQNNERP